MNLAFFGDSLTEGKPGVSFYELLQFKLPEHEMYNYGKGGDTVKSHYRRIKTLDIDRPFDVAVLWIGVNDVMVHLSKTYPWLKRLAGQPWSKTVKDFTDYYIGTIDWLIKHSIRVIVLPPMFIGESPVSGCNRQLERLADAIKDLTVYRENVEYLDIREFFISELNRETISEYMPKSVLVTLLDGILLQSNGRVDKKSAKRGLQFTLDGVHLNGKGAEMIAEILAAAIEQKKPKDVASRFVFE
ncbi:SGNH/GDSL hydrolase family protein [candidate division KSB1 bacterium]